MAGDIPIQERLIITGGAGARSAEAGGQGRAVHVYGDRVRIIEVEEAAERTQAPAAEAPSLDGLSEVEALGAAAFQIRQSEEFLEAKRNRQGQGDAWNLPPGGCAAVAAPSAERAGAMAGAPPTSAYLEGSVAVGIVIVAGPGPLQFSAAERTKVVAEVQNGLSFFAATNPRAGLTFTYDIRFVQLNVAANPGAPDLEALWRNPAMAALGFPATWAGVGQYVESLRGAFGTRWTYCCFFTKYPLTWFGYASIGGPRIVMHYDNDGWGPDNIDRVFAHETGHIFNAPDEYAASGCSCGGAWGRFGRPNTNCQNCAPGGGIMCLMKGNDWTMCPVTPAHLGWTPARIFAKHSHRCLDIHGASGGNGTTLIQWDFHGGSNQQFQPDHVGGGFYRLVALHSGKVLDVTGASTANGAAVVQWDWHGGDNQLFRIVPLGDGYCQIVAKHSGRVLDVTGASDANGAQIIQWDWHGGDNQRWLLTVPIVAKHSGRVLDVNSGSTGDGAQIIQFDYHGAGNQIFRPEPLGDGFYRFVAQHSGKVLDVAGASTASGAKIVQWPWHGGDNQRFAIQPLGDGHVRVVAKHSGKVLDVTGASTGNGAEIIQWDWHGGNNQRWLLPLW
jgi:hypothetical protein